MVSNLLCPYWKRAFLAAPTVLGVIDTYGIELIHPMHEGRSPQQIGRKGLSNHRSIVGGKLCLLLNQYGLIVGWDCATTNVSDKTFQWLMRQFNGRMIVLSDTGFHAAEVEPAHLKLCQQGEWQNRLLVETGLSMLTLVSHLKKVMHRRWAYLQARLAFTIAAFNVLVQWHGLQPNASGFVPLSMAKFSMQETSTIGYYRASGDVPRGPSAPAYEVGEAFWRHNDRMGRSWEPLGKQDSVPGTRSTFWFHTRVTHV